MKVFNNIIKRFFLKIGYIPKPRFRNTTYNERKYNIQILKLDKLYPTELIENDDYLSFLRDKMKLELMDSIDHYLEWNQSLHPYDHSHTQIKLEIRVLKPIY